MDYLPVEFFEYDKNEPIKNVVANWIDRNLWFFKVEKNEKPLFFVEQNGFVLMETNSNDKKKVFSSETLAKEYIEKSKLPNASVTKEIYTYYTAQDDKGIFINHNNGTPIEFKKEEMALRAALFYNFDLVKIRLAFSQFKTK